MHDVSEKRQSSFVRYITRTMVGAMVGGVLIGYFVDWLEHLPRGQVLQTIVIAGIGALLLGLLIGGLNFKRFISPMAVVNDHIREIAAGNLTARIDVSQAGELRPIAVTLNDMAGTWQALIAHIDTDAERLSTSAQSFLKSAAHVQNAILQINASLQQVAAGAQEQTASLDGTRLTIAELSRDIAGAAANAVQVSTTSQDSLVYAEAGDQFAARSAEQMKTIQQSVNLSSEIIQEFISQSEEIAQIITSIRSIADQTNMLSLNATIEAARAGEYGRGFTVVAQEIGKLASQSSQFAIQITELVQAVQVNSNQSTEAMKRVEHEVHEGMNISEEMKRVFTRIRKSVEGVAQGTNQISAATQNMSHRAGQLSETASSLTQIAASTALQTTEAAEAVDQQLTSIEQITDASKVLMQMAQSLQGQLRQFVIRDNHD